MKTIPLMIDDELAGTLEQASTERRVELSELVSAILRRHFDSERNRGALNDPRLLSIYQGLSEEDTILAEAGMDDYSVSLNAADR